MLTGSRPGLRRWRKGHRARRGGELQSPAVVAAMVVLALVSLKVNCCVDLVRPLWRYYGRCVKPLSLQLPVGYLVQVSRIEVQATREKWMIRKRASKNSLVQTEAELPSKNKRIKTNKNSREEEAKNCLGIGILGIVRESNWDRVGVSFWGRRWWGVQPKMIPVYLPDSAL